MSTFTVPLSYPPLALSAFLRREKISLTLRRKLKQTAETVQLNGHPVPWQTVVNPGDIITIHWPDACNIPPLPIPLFIAYEDESLLVVDKPAGLLVHPTTDFTRPSLANAIIHHLRAQGNNGGFHPIHRLDRNTSGLIMIAKNPYIQHLFSGQTGMKIKRIYLAAVHGIINPPAGTINAPIGRHPGSIIERMVRDDGQNAITSYETISNHGTNSLLKVQILTGRTHQIRVHLAYKGHPIWGDDLYGGSTELIPRQALHAAEITFSHPLTGELITLASQLPDDIRALLSGLRPSVREK